MGKLTKNIIILQHNGGRLANQLWLYISVLAYALEKNYEIENYSFFEYAAYFNIRTKNKLFNLIFIKIYSFFNPERIIGQSNKMISKIYTRIFRVIYGCLFKFIKSRIEEKNIVEVKHNINNKKSIYLPPSLNADDKFQNFDHSSEQRIYLVGWLFRNPLGIIKHREQIIKSLTPQIKYSKKANEFIKDIRKNFKNIIGVHIRQADYKKHYDGQLYFSSSEVAKILKELLNAFNYLSSETVFVFCSDGKIEKNFFLGLNIVISKNFFITDLLILSQTDKIIGSDSTFGTFASYYGNIPFVVMNKSKIDWDYYKNKNSFFEDKKCQMTCY